MKDDYGDEIDLSSVREKYETDPLVRSLMDLLAQQKEVRKTMTVDELCDLFAEAGVDIHRRDVIRVLQSLNGGNRGSFVVGRKGFPSRFQFYVSPVELAKAASAKHGDNNSGDVMLAHKFRLRPHLEISIDLPADLTHKDVARITHFLKTIPFERTDSADAP